MKLQFYPLDVTYKIVENKALIYLYGRTKEGEQICLVDDQFEPYFYILLNKGESAETFQERIDGNTFTYKGREGKVTKTKILTKQLGREEKEFVQVFTDLPSSVSTVSAALKDDSRVEKTYEYDIVFTRRYLLDKKITPLMLHDVEGEIRKEKSRVPVFTIQSITPTTEDGYEQLRILSFDIETYNPHQKISNPDHDPIVMIALYAPHFKKVITYKHIKGMPEFVDIVDSEEALIRKFQELVLHYAPDILVGYYSDGFDFPYILKRAQKNKIKLDLNLDHTSPTLARGTLEGVDMTGTIHLDILNFIRRVTRLNLKTDSLKMDAVAHELLGSHKYVIDIENLATYWDNSSPKLVEFAEYNLKDAELCYEITTELLPNIIEFVKLIGQTIPDISKMRFAQLCEWYLMKRAQDTDMIIPNKPGQSALVERQMSHVQGAFVFEPKAGLYERVIVCDFRSLYPSIIVAHNISPETLNVPDKNIEHVPGHENLWFTKERDGFFSTILEEIMQRRGRVKEMMKKADPKKKKLLDARQYSLKILLNSFYGYLGFFGARWYSKECAAAVTAYGRHHIHDVIDQAKKKGFQVIYSDTDSIFFTLDHQTLDQARSFVDEINYELPELMELEFEGYYSSALFVSTKGEKEEDIGAKKRYALCDEGGHISIKGFEAVRRNSSIIAKEIQLEVIRILLQEKNPAKALAHLTNRLIDLRKHEIENAKMIIITQVTRPLEDYTSIGPHIAAARLMKKKGAVIEPGMMIKYIVQPGKGRIGDRVSLPEDTPQGNYDAEYYIAHQIIPAVERIFEVFKINVEDIAEKKNQQDLSSFFK